MSRLLLVIVAFVVVLVPSGAQAFLRLPSAQPTAEEVDALRTKFQTEREEAIKAQFPVASLATADDLARRAEASAKSGDRKAAVRHFRDARWQIPYRPAGLPDHILRVLGEGRMRHADWVSAVAYSSDGLRLASASRDGTAKIWDLGNGRELVTYRGHADQANDQTKAANTLAVGDVAFDPKGGGVATVCGNQVHLWDPTNGKLKRVLYKLVKGDKPLRSISFSPDGALLAVGGEDGILRVVSTATGQVVMTTPSRNCRIERVAFSPNGKLVAAVDQQGVLSVFKASAPAPVLGIGVIEGTGGEALGVGFTADSLAVFTAGKDGKAKLTAGTTADGIGAGNTATRLQEYVGHVGAVTCLAVSRDGKLLVTGGADKTVRVWEAAGGKQTRLFQGHKSQVTAVAIRPDGRQIASAGDDGVIRLWDMTTADDNRILTGATDSIWTLAVSPDDKKIATAGADRTIRIYDPETGRLEAELTGHTAPITTLAFLPKSTRLASAGGDKVVKIWDLPGKKVVQELTGHTSAVLALGVSRDGKTVVSGSADKTVRGWNVADGTSLWTWTGKSAVCGVAIRPDGKSVAAGLADGGLVVLDITGTQPKTLFWQPVHVGGVAAVAYSPDGSRAATVGGDGVILVWTVDDTGMFLPMTKFENQSRTQSASGFSPLSAVAFSPDGRFLAATGADMVLHIWDIQTKAEVRGLRGHTDWATAVAFSPDGRFLASAAVDKTARIFELSPQETAPSSGHMQTVLAVAVSPDGKRAVTASKEQTMKIWNLETGREEATLVGDKDNPFSVTFLGNNKVVMGGSPSNANSGKLYFWTTTPARQYHVVPTGQVYFLAGAADGSRVAAWNTVQSTTKKKINTFDTYASDGSLISSVRDSEGKDEESGITTATFTSDLKWAVRGDEQGTVRIWDLGKKERIGGDWPLVDRPIVDLGLTQDKKLLVVADDPDMKSRTTAVIKVADVATRSVLSSVTAHKGGVMAVLVAPNGKLFVTIGKDQVVKAWSLADPKTPKEVRTWAMPVEINAGAFTPDGKRLVTGNKDGTAFVLDLDGL